MTHPNLFVTSESAVIRKDRIEALIISENKRVVTICCMSDGGYAHELQWTELKDWEAEYEALIAEIFGKAQKAAGDLLTEMNRKHSGFPYMPSGLP